MVTKPPALIEPLTKRELEILSLLEAGETNSQISARLNLSINSVKWYARQIFGKLAVENRRQAVIVAKELGILTTNSAATEARSNMRFQHNLPLQLSNFIGRESDIESICRLIQDNRLVTLTGSGGAGKTRLSLKVAEVVLPAFQDGVWQVELAPIHDPSLIASEIVRSLGMTLEGQPGSIHERLHEALRPRQMLLLFENCEHIISGASRFAEELLQTCPHLHILATSREKLGVPGEVSYRVPSLSFPDAGNHQELEDAAMLQYEAVRLFVDRVKMGDPSFAWNESSKMSIAIICQRLDGIPLAIELAAARTNILRVEQIAEKLEENLGLLSSSRPSIIPRHQTLFATIDWSYRLLDKVEQAFLRRLSIFAGGFSLSAAQHVAAIDGATPDDVQVLDLLSQLVDKSLVHVIRTEDQEPRYRILETVRQYLHEKVDEAGEREAIREKHVSYFLQLVETAEPELIRKDQLYWMRLLSLEYDNLREAIHWTQQNGQVEAFLRIVGALRGFIDQRTNWEEHIQWAISAVKLGKEIAELQNSPMLAKALLCAGWLFVNRQNPKEGAPFVEEALSLFRYQKDPIGTAASLYMKALNQYNLGNIFESEQYWYPFSRYKKCGAKTFNQQATAKEQEFPS